ncbi:MAG: EAL domain-containing protein [Pseudomonadota bacterium]
MRDAPSPQSYEGSWHWTSGEQRLKIEPDAGSSVRDLKGVWSIASMARVLDGFSHGRLQRSLSPGMTIVNCPLGLSDGRAVQMIGAALPDGNLQGVLLLSEAGAVSTDVASGPDLEPVFQPIQNVSTGEWAGFEALARWTALRGEGDGRPLDNEGLASNMLIRAAEAIARWQALTGNQSLFVHVNLTGRDLEQGGLPGLVSALIDGYGLPPGSLRIELTEQAALRDADKALEAARVLKASGAGLILDDFGSGHSSFSWLADLPADGLKVDPDLIRRMGQPRTDAILKAVNALAHELSMSTTAEGVESRHQLESARSFGFDYVQGYLIARPMPASAIDDALNALSASGG